jgi:hypothetical protein
MINYSYKVNEEIARWIMEVYVRNNKSLGWWIAFTNPTAGPWKKIIAPDSNGLSIEIYRFVREEERPDLILVNDKKKVIMIVEAKDYCSKLIADSQMKKSVRVIKDVSIILRNKCDSKHWEKRKNYKIIASFLWFCEKEDIASEDKLTKASFDKFNMNIADKNLLNIIISKTSEENLESTFIYNGDTSKDLDFDFS